MLTKIMNKLHKYLQIVGTTSCHFIRSKFYPRKLLKIMYNFNKYHCAPSTNI